MSLGIAKSASVTSHNPLTKDASQAESFDTTNFFSAFLTLVAQNVTPAQSAIRL